MAFINYTFRLQKAQWDFGSGVGTQNVMCFHQYIDGDGFVLPPGSSGGSWEPFIPGPVIRGNVGDIVRVTLQNRMYDAQGNFIEALKTSTTIHWHGIELSNAHDGTPVTQFPVQAFDDFVYKFELLRPGVYWYHPHWDSMIQTLLGGYGAIIVEDGNYQSLRNQKLIPHLDRTFDISLMDLSFQSNREQENLNSYVPLAEVPNTDPVYIRNIQHFLGGLDQNFGDVQIINGKHRQPFNNINGNFQQFWYKGERNTASPITIHKHESLSFQILNTGLHRFYKVHLAYKTSPQGDWIKSDNLFRIGGEGGLLENARSGGGEFGEFRIVGYKGREASTGGLQSIQAESELTAGEFLLSESSRIIVAFKIDQSWTDVALRVNGFSVVKNSGSNNADELPEDMIIAHFENIGTTPNADYLLNSPINNGSPILAALPVSLENLADVSDPVTAYN